MTLPIGFILFFIFSAMGGRSDCEFRLLLGLFRWLRGALPLTGMFGH